MGDFRDQYLEWILAGGKPADRPAWGVPRSVPMGTGGAPTHLPARLPRSTIVPPGTGGAPVPLGMPAIPPEARLVPQPPPGRQIPSGPVTRGISPWQMMKDIPGGLMELAPGVARAAGGAALAHLAFPPEAGDPAEDQLMLERYLNEPDLPTVQVTRPVNSVGGTPVSAIPETTPQKHKAYGQNKKPINSIQDIRSAAANGISAFETEDPRVKKRLEEREQIKREMAVPVESIQDLRLKARMLREH